METPTIEQVTKEMNSLSALLKEAEKNEANLSGRLSESMKRLKTEQGLDSIEAATAELVILEAEKNKLSSSVIKKFQTLKESYEWQ